ncbi:MAG: Rpn family recombination-promoting nuclease/putative transposase [Spirochaeta sp.]|jgi:hypothetical protein|nr:Rpn family recombination-promoting nuclease/putative transposase [Spirochaeta sp.]
MNRRSLNEKKASNRTRDEKRRDATKSVHPHDRLFKEVFSTREAQKDLIQMALPAGITSRFLMGTVRDAGQETGSGRMDLLLTVETIDDTTEYVYVLVEHKSYRDQTVAVQLLGYVAGIMRRHGKLPMPIIHPVVFYHGAETWTAPTELTGLHQTVESAGTGEPNDTAPQKRHPPGGYPVNLRYYLFDLEEIPPEQIAERARARASAGMIAMKYIQRELEAGDIQIIARVVARSPLPGDLWHTITTYVLSHVEGRYRQPLMTAIEENVYTEEEGVRMKSIADVIREEGLEQGKADVLVRQLRRRFGLTEEEEAVVRDCHDAERLDEAAEACVDPDAGKGEILALLRFRA